MKISPKSNSSMEKVSVHTFKDSHVSTMANRWRDCCVLFRRWKRTMSGSIGQISGCWVMEIQSLQNTSNQRRVFQRKVFSIKEDPRSEKQKVVPKKKSKKKKRSP